MKQNKSGKMSTGKVVAMSAGIVALATAAYYFFGPEGKKNQKKMKSWMIKMKGDIVEKIEDATEISESVYNEIVESVAQQYAKTTKAAPTEIASYVALLKKQWRAIVKSTTPKKKNIKKPAPKKVSPVKKTVSKKK